MGRGEGLPGEAVDQEGLRRGRQEGSESPVFKRHYADGRYRYFRVQPNPPACVLPPPGRVVRRRVPIEWCVWGVMGKAFCLSLCERENVRGLFIDGLRVDFVQRREDFFTMVSNLE